MSHIRMSHVTFRTSDSSGNERHRLMWMSHVTLMDESCHTYEWVMSHSWMSHVTLMNESCQTHEWVMSHIWMSHATHMNVSCNTWMSHVTHMNESCHTYEWVTGPVSQRWRPDQWQIHLPIDQLSCPASPMLQCITVCCSVLQCAAVYYSVLQCITVCCSVLQCVAVYYSVLQCVAVYCSVF